MGRDTEFAEFARANQQSMYRHAYLLSGDGEQAKDLVQTTLLKLYTAWSKFSDARHPRAYAHTVLVRTYLSGQRRSRRERELAELIDTSSGHDRTDLRLTVLEAVASLPPRARAVVLLRYWEDFSVEQTAHALGCSRGTVKSLSSRSLAVLRARLGDTFHTLIET